MRRIIKGIIIFFIVIASLVIGFVLIRNPLIKAVVTTKASESAGAPVHIDSFSFGIFKQAIRIKGFKLFNPEGFPKEAIFDIPEVSIDYDLSALLAGKLHLPYLAVNLKEVVVIRNKEGKLNVDTLKAATKEEKPSEKEEAKEPSEAMEMQIDVMKLSIGKVIYRDYSMGEKPIVVSYDVGIKEKTYKNVTDARELAVLIMVEAIGPTAIKAAVVKGKEAVVKGAETAIGVVSLPAEGVGEVADIAGKLLGKEGGVAFNVGFDKAYEVTLGIIQQIGEVTKDDKDKGLIKAKVDGSDVTVEITKKAAEEVQIKVSARKLVLPQPKLAEEILSKISEKLR